MLKCTMRYAFANCVYLIWFWEGCILDWKMIPLQLIYVLFLQEKESTHEDEEYGVYEDGEEVGPDEGKGGGGGGGI